MKLNAREGKIISKCRVEHYQAWTEGSLWSKYIEMIELFVVNKKSSLNQVFHEKTNYLLMKTELTSSLFLATKLLIDKIFWAEKIIAYQSLDRVACESK